MMGMGRERKGERKMVKTQQIKKTTTQEEEGEGERNWATKQANKIDKPLAMVAR